MFVVGAGWVADGWWMTKEMSIDGISVGSSDQAAVEIAQSVGELDHDASPSRLVITEDVVDADSRGGQPGHKSGCSRTDALPVHHGLPGN